MTSGQAETVAVSSPRTSARLLLDRHFGTVFWGKSGNLLANWAFTIITVTVAYDVTGSAAWTGAVSAAQMAPQLLLTLPSGRLSDTYGERLPLIGGGLVSGVASIALALLLWRLGPDNQAAVIALLVCALVSGCGLALSAPAQHSVVTRLVRPAELSQAISLNFLPTAVARTLGPAGGAFLLAVVGPPFSVLVVGLVLIGTAVAIHLVRLPGGRPKDATETDATIWAAFRYVGRDRVILAYLLAVAAIGLGSEPVITLAPAIADAVGRHSAAGWLVAAFGAGGALGVLAHRLARGRLAPKGEGMAAMCALAATVGSLAVVRGFWVTLAVLAAAGCSAVVGMTAFSVAVQQRCLPSLLGRVMAMWVLAFAGVRPLAALVIGVVAEVFSLPTALVGTSMTLLLLAALVLYVARRGGRRNVEKLAVR